MLDRVSPRAQRQALRDRQQAPLVLEATVEPAKLLAFCEQIGFVASDLITQSFDVDSFHLGHRNMARSQAHLLARLEAQHGHPWGWS